MLLFVAVSGTMMENAPQMSPARDAKRAERKKVTDAALYLKKVANGKQKIYVSNKRTANRDRAVLRLLPPDKRHLKDAVLRKLSQHKWSSDNRIQMYICECDLEHKRSLAASASASGSAASISMPANVQTGTSTEDTPNQVPAHKPSNADQSPSLTASFDAVKDESNASAILYRLL